MSKAKTDLLSHNIPVGFTDADLLHLQVTATKRGLSVSALIRSIIRQALEADHATQPAHPTTQAATQ